jgi:hypothetical protein
MPSVAVNGISFIRPLMRRMSRVPHLVVDDAGAHEQARLEGGVVDDVEHPGHHRQRLVQPEQQRDQPEVADGAVGQQALQVVLEDRHVGAQQQRGQPDAGDDPEPGLAAAQRRVQRASRNTPHFTMVAECR